MSPRRFLTFSLLFPTFLLNGCRKENAFDCLKSTGKITTEARALPAFQTLKVFDNLDVKIVADTSVFVEVKAGENLQENIQTEVKNGKLWVQNINRCNWARSYHKPLEIRVHTPRLVNIFHDGDGTISSDGTLPADTLFLHLTSAGDYDLELNTQTLWLDMYELGDMRLRGFNLKLDAYVYSMGSLKATGLQNQEAYLHLTNLGDAHVEASRILSANIDGKGNVYYQNPPAEIHRQGNGGGQILQAK